MTTGDRAPHTDDPQAFDVSGHLATRPPEAVGRVLADSRWATATTVSAPTRLLAGAVALLVVDVTAHPTAGGASGPAADRSPTGRVTVHLEGADEPASALDTGELDARGSVMLSVVLPLGEHVLRTTYAGDTRWAPSSCARALQVAAHPTVVTVAGHAGGVPSGQSVTLTAWVSSTEESRTPSGTVVFLAGGRELGAARVDAGGAAVLPVDALESGVHRIVAAYSGDASHAASRSTPIPQAVAVAPTRLVLDRVVSADDILVTVTVVDAGTGVPLPGATGDVVVHVGEAGPLRVALRDGIARVRLPVGPDQRWRADYTGDAEHAACTGVS